MIGLHQHVQTVASRITLIVTPCVNKVQVVCTHRSLRVPKHAVGLDARTSPRYINRDRWRKNIRDTQSFPPSKYDSD